jgi:AcrR family transcriptional regulator
METGEKVTPNRRGVQSREAVLDAAERVLAQYGYEGASLILVVEASGIPISSIYHYFGSKDGVLLAVMERGAERFFQSLPELDERVGSPQEHLTAAAAALCFALEQHPDFLRLLTVMAAQPPVRSAQEAHAVVGRVRKEALRRLRQQAAIAFEISPRSTTAQRLARFALAVIDGAFVAWQADSKLRLHTILEHLPVALIAMHQALTGLTE